MTDNAALPLRGEKLSMASPPFSGGSALNNATRSALGLVKAMAGPRARAIGTAVFWCGAICAWGAPALLLHWYRGDHIFDALLRSSVRGNDGELLALSVLLAYVIASGLLLGSATARLASRLGWSRVVLHLAVAPLIALSLIATMAAATPLFIGLLIRCVPSLL